MKKDKRHVDIDALTLIGKQLLVAIGEDPEREGIKGTPLRWAKWWAEFIDYDPGRIDTVFESVQNDQIVVVNGMRVWSLCEHHLLPFNCDITIGYISRDKVIGLSKLGRIAQKYAHGLQIQEKLVSQIADELISILGHNDVAVLAHGEHLCMTMRGIKMPAKMTSSVIRGTFLDNYSARQEFYALAIKD